MDKNQRFNMECDLRMYKDMLACGHWHVGDKHAFTESEAAYIKQRIEDLEAFLNTIPEE